MFLLFCYNISDDDIPKATGTHCGSPFFMVE